MGGTSCRQNGMSGFLFDLKLMLPPETKLRQGNVFTHVCHSVHRGEEAFCQETSQTETPQTETPQTETLQTETPPSWTETPLLDRDLLKQRPPARAGGTHPTGMYCCFTTGWERLIRSHSSAKFCFELSGNSN